jgi:signal transduction histidine kinase
LSHHIRVRWPIRFEVATSGVVVALLVSLFLGYYAPARYREEALRAKYEAVAGTAEMVALSVGVGLRLNAPSTVSAAITWARRDSALVYLAVIDSTDVLFATFNPHEISIDPRTISGDGVIERNDKLFVAAPIRFADQVLGRLVIGTSLAPLRTQLEEQRRVGLAVSVTVLAVGVLLSLVLAGVMTRPVLALREAAERVASGCYDVRIPEPSGNEIGALARAFAIMVERIRTQLSTLELQARELVAARDTALEATTAKSAFLAMMSHEIRTPMNGVLGMLQLLRQDRLTTEQREFADIAYRSGESLLTLINDILDFSKIEARKLELERIDFDLTETLDQVTQVVGERASSKGLELVCAARHTVPTALRGDPGRLRQVLVNLCGNAVKFTPAGDVALTVSVVDRNDQYIVLRFEVADTGIGLSASDQLGLFRPFAQADASTTRSYGGSRLGLSNSKQLVALMKDRKRGE